MMRILLAPIVAVSVLASIPAHAQTDLGSLRGYVKDEQGSVLPGVTVTATGAELLAPVVAVTDSAGYYRLLNLPPGTVTVTAELSGFAVYRREGIVMRAGSTFSLDIEMKVGTLQETVTVTAESPMLETLKSSTIFTIGGELLREVPVTSRRVYTDLFDMIPGVGSRQVNDGSGMRAYYFLGARLDAHSVGLEGAPLGSFGRFQANRASISGDAVADAELRTGGADASTPLSTGIFLNVVTPRGGNAFKGSAAYTLQPLSWNGDNSSGGRVSGGVPKPEGVRQADLSLGGPIVQNKTWFFSSFRYGDIINGISRTPLNLSVLTAFRPNFQLFDNTFKIKNPYVKVTTQLNPNHELAAFYQYDRGHFTMHREFDTDQVNFGSAGGWMVQAKLGSSWSNHLFSQISVAYNDKDLNSEETYRDLKGSGPQVLVHNDIFLSSGLPVGTGMLVRMNNPLTTQLEPASMVLLRGEVTYFKEGWVGSHEFKSGVYAAPRSRVDFITRFQNDGFNLEEVRQIDPNNPDAGVTPFHMRYITPSSLPTMAVRDKDIGIYVQDSWKPAARITANVGVRVDWLRRYDAIQGVQRMKSVEVGPRFGVSYLVTKDAKNVLRVFAGRIHDQVCGCDAIETFAAAAPTTSRDVYIDKNGNQTTVITPAPTAAQSALQFNTNVHQPYVDEFIVGFRKQFPGQLSLDVSGRRRAYKDQFGLVDVNGIYPSGPYQPFGGFGLVDPNRGILYQQRNNTWSQEVVTTLEVVAAKNLSHNVQAMASLTRQWQHLAGTWNPTDPARFIQPDAFSNNGNLPSSAGNADHNTLDGRGMSGSAAGWKPYSLRVVGQYFAPWGIKLAGSYEVGAGDYSGPIVTRLSAPDPRFGPARVALADGTTQPNPLATTIRFAFPTRGDGQALNEAARYLQLKIGRNFKFGRHQFDSSLNIFNLFNSGANTQYSESGANQLYSPFYLGAFNRLTPRSFQLVFVYRF